MKRNIAITLFLLAAIVIISAPNITAQTGWVSWAKDAHNSRIADDVLVPPLTLKLQGVVPTAPLTQYCKFFPLPAICFFFYPNGARLLYQNGTLFAALPQMAADTTFLVAYNAKNLQSVWSVKSNGISGYSMGFDSIADGYIWAGIDHARGYQVNIATGSQTLLSALGDVGVGNSYSNIDSSGLYGYGDMGVDSPETTVKADSIIDSNGKVNLTLRWSNSRESQGKIGVFWGLGQIAIDNNVLYVPDGILWAYNVTNGNVIWQKGAYPNAGKVYNVSHFAEVVYSNGVVYTAGRELLAFDQSTNASNWTVPRLYAYNAASGILVNGFPIDLPEFSQYNIQTYSRFILGNFMGTPFEFIISNNIAYVSAFDRIEALALPTGALLWNYSRTIPQNTYFINLNYRVDVGEIVLSGNTLYATDRLSNKLVGLDISNGNKLWQVNASGNNSYFSGMIIANHTLYASTVNGGLYAYEQSSPPASCCNYSTAKFLDNGGDSSHVVIHLIASGYGAADQAAAALVLKKLNNSLFASGSAPGTNTFHTFSNDFNVYSTTIKAPANGTKISAADMQVIINHTGVKADFIFVMQNINSGDEGEYNGYIDSTPTYELYTGDQQFQINHELAHMIVSVTPGNSLMKIDDEYKEEVNPCTGSTRFSYNVHDRYSNDKWGSNLSPTMPVEGGAYCSKYVWRPTANNWMYDASNNTGFDPPTDKAVALSIGKQPKIGTVPSTPPSLTVDGISNGGTYSGLVNVKASVPLGVDRLEFYIQKYDGSHYTGQFVNKDKKINRLLKNSAGDQILSAANLHVSLSNRANIAWDAFSYSIGGNTYNKPANSTGKSPSGTIVYDTWGAFALDIGADGTVDTVSAVANSITGYTSPALAIIGIPVPATGHARMGTVTVNRGAGGTVVLGTSTLLYDPFFYGVLIDSYLQWDFPSYLYPNNQYAIDVLVYDKNWNVAHKQTHFTLNNAIVGKGCTSNYVIDDDCDGYGVGSSLGPDADDADSSVNTPDTVVNRYGDMPTYVKARMAAVSGQPNGGILRWVFIDPINGHDSGVSVGLFSATYATAESRPFQTFAGLGSSIHAGDVIIYRSTPFSEDHICDSAGTCGSGASGTQANPIYIIAYPGESVTLSHASWDNLDIQGASCANLKRYWIVDGIGGGLVFKGNLPTRGGDGLDFSYSDHMIFRELECTESGRCSHSTHCVTNLLFERNSIHSSTNEHLLYWGSGPTGFASDVGPNGNIVFSENLVYSSVSHGLKNNGPTTGTYLITRNKFSLTGNANINFERGGSNVTITNNIFDSMYALSLNFYGGYGSANADMTRGFTNMPMENFLVENNVFWHGVYDPTLNYPGGTDPFAAVSYTNQFYIYQAPAWQANHAYTTITAAVAPPNGDNMWVSPTVPTGCIYGAYIGGTSSGSEPANWPIVSGVRMIDGGVTWLSDCQSKISNHIYRNNIIAASGTSSLDTLFRIGEDGVVVTGFTGANTPVIDHNLFYQASSQKMVHIGGSSPSTMTLAEVLSSGTYSPYWHDNTWENPLFIDINDTYYLSPWKINTATSNSSPAKGLGVATGMPSTDIRGFTRIGYDAGAYSISTSPLTNDTTAPSTPAALQAIAASYSQINLSWSASSDDVAVAGYRVYRNGSQIATTSNIFYVDALLLPLSSYSYRVAAYDNAGHLSNLSVPVFATTFHRADTDKNRHISFAELAAFISRWQISSNDVSISEAIEALKLWKGGCP